MRISEKILRALPLTRNDSRHGQRRDQRRLAHRRLVAVWLVHTIAIGINLTWLSSGDADALRTALHVIPGVRELRRTLR